ncbi:MAG TPA: hypothetical protein ENF25_02760 [Thermoprotei archaeon]|nr:hypothetical protein [Thermoprotei archaeon]
MVKVTLGDAFRVYIKPSLDGRLVIRKKNTIRYSEKVKAINEKVATAKPAIRAKERCLRDHPEFGNRCPIKYFIKYLREEMKSAVR